MGADVGASGAAGGWFAPGDDVGRAWDEAEAILLASEDLDAVMDVIREAESPVEARRALKFGFGFTGRQAALLLTLPVMSFTRSERRRLDEARRVRMDLLADVTGVLPAVPATERAVGGAAAHAAHLEATSSGESSFDERGSGVWSAGEAMEFREQARGPEWGDSAADWSRDFGAAFDGVLAGISSAMQESGDFSPSADPAPPAPEERAPVVAAQTVSDAPRPPVTPVQSGGGGRVGRVAEEPARPIRRSLTSRQDASAVLDEQIGELCDAIAMVVGKVPPAGAWSDDPRSSADRSGALLDSFGVDDQTGIRTLLWHLRRTGLDALEGLLPFAEPLSASQGFDAQSAQFESAMSTGGIGSEPGADVRWASRLWPIAERRGFGFAVAFGAGPDAGSVWAYGGDEPLHRLWDSVVDLLVELYQSLTTGSACDAAVPAVLDGRVLWTNLS